MREILFRGKAVSDGRWVIGGIVPAFHPNFDNKDIEKFTAGTANTYAICDEKKDYFVDIETIGQFTGLTDKNGRRIFEGDIVMSDYFLLSNPNQKKSYGIVGYGAFNCSCCDGVYGWHFGEEDIREHKGYVVVGNIYDNPELLEV